MFIKRIILMGLCVFVAYLNASTDNNPVTPITSITFTLSSEAANDIKPKLKIHFYTAKSKRINPEDTSHIPVESKVIDLSKSDSINVPAKANSFRISGRGFNKGQPEPMEFISDFLPIDKASYRIIGIQKCSNIMPPSKLPAIKCELKIE